DPARAGRSHAAAGPRLRPRPRARGATLPSRPAPSAGAPLRAAARSRPPRRAPPPRPPRAAPDGQRYRRPPRRLLPHRGGSRRSPASPPYALSPAPLPPPRGGRSGMLSHACPINAFRLAGGSNRVRSSASAASRAATSRSPFFVWNSSLVMSSAARIAALCVSTIGPCDRTFFSAWSTYAATSRVYSGGRSDRTVYSSPPIITFTACFLVLMARLPRRSRRSLSARLRPFARARARRPARPPRGGGSSRAGRAPAHPPPPPPPLFLHQPARRRTPSSSSNALRPRATTSSTSRSRSV